MILDTTVRVSDLFLLGGGIVSFLAMYTKFIRVLDAQNEFNRMVLHMLGSAKDDCGVFGDLKALKKESQRHRNWLIELQAAGGHRLDDRS